MFKLNDNYLKTSGKLSVFPLSERKNRAFQEAHPDKKVIAWNRGCDPAPGTGHH